MAQGMVVGARKKIFGFTLIQAQSFQMRSKAIILSAVTLLAAFAVFFFVEPISQDIRYHQFADKRIVFGIRNAFDVLSNIPFIVIGLLGIALIVKRFKESIHSPNLQYLVFFIGVFLTGLGSSYYHYGPSNNTLVWDRLPMTIAFVGFFCSLVAELISRRASVILLYPLLVVGMVSVLYWHWSEKQGFGDLRLYALVQYLPIILAPLILSIYKIPKNYLRYILGLGGFYLLSKIFEVFDSEIFELFNAASGHTLKHFSAAGGTCCILRMLYKR